jgi:uncharacterized protein
VKGKREAIPDGSLRLSREIWDHPQVSSSPDAFPALAALAAPVAGRALLDEELLPVGGPPSLDDLRGRRTELLDRVACYGVTELRVFGSVARGRARPGSDVDLIVDLDPARHGLFDLAGVAAALEEALGCAVDVIAPGFLAQPLPEQIAREAVLL